MKLRPKILDIFCFVFLLIGLSFPVQLFFAHGHSISEIGIVFAKLTWLNYFIIFMCGFSAFLVYRASQLLVYSLPLLVLSVALNNYVVGSYGYDFSMTATTFSTLGFLGFMGLIYFSPVMDLVKQPSMRWWLIPKRVKAQLETNINPYVGSALKSTTHDISETGFFLECEENDLESVAVGSLTSTRIKVSQTLSLQCEARVVRRSKADSHKPAGVGFEFINLDRNQRAVLKTVVEEVAEAA